MSEWNRTIQQMNDEARAEHAPAARTREDIERALNAARKSLDWFSRQPERAQRCRIPGYGNIYGPSLTRSIARLEKELASFDRAAADLAATGVAVIKDGERIPPEDFFAEAGDTPDLRKILKNCAENVVIGVDMGWDMGGIVYSMHDACVAFTRLPAASQDSRADVREAFRAGWKVNAVGTETHPQEYLDGCEEADWQEYKKAAANLLRTPDIAATGTDDPPLTIADYEEVLADKRRLVRELDVAMHGEDGAAKQASLCDLIEPARELRERADKATADAAASWDKCEERRIENERLQERVEALEALINSPHNNDWLEGTRIEAAHQVERWGVQHDAGKKPLDWFWLIGFLAQKAAASAMAGDVEKAKHHTISTAAALLNWHRQLSGIDNRMRPGIEPPKKARPENQDERVNVMATVLR